MAGVCRSARPSSPRPRSGRKGVSAAFIKELMRASPRQASPATAGTARTEDISEALDDMLFAGGRLNVKLLGGAREMADG